MNNALWPRSPRILVLGHYPLDRLDRAPKVRTYRMIEALGRRGEVTVITGTRRERARLLRDARRQRLLDRIDVVYLESGSSLATPADLWFLRDVARRRIPLGIFIRDIYQRFPELYPAPGLKGRLLRWGYEVSLGCYRRLATTLFFPTAGLAAMVPAPRKALLPPAGRLVGDGEAGPCDPLQVIYVGAGGPHDGVELLVEAFSRVRRQWPGASLVLVMRRQEAPGVGALPGVRRVEADGAALDALLASSGVAVVPRPDTPYNRIALPVKLMEYLSFGLPVVVTGPSEAQRIVADYRAGLAVAPTAEGLAEGLALLFADRALWARCRDNARRAVADSNLWDHRADTVLKSLWHPAGDG